jgi:hypothetical protein
VLAASSAFASSTLRPSTRSSVNPGAAKAASAGSRIANSVTIGSWSIRRAANTNASADAWSSQCASSSTQRTGCSAAAAARSPSVAAYAEKRSGFSISSSASAACIAFDCGSGSPRIRPMTGPTSSCNAANGSSASDSTPRARRTRNPSAASTACSSSAVLPTPASPRKTRAPPLPPAASSRRRAICARSASRPTNMSQTVRGPGLRHNARAPLSRPPVAIGGSRELPEAISARASYVLPRKWAERARPPANDLRRWDQK